MDSFTEKIKCDKIKIVDVGAMLINSKPPVYDELVKSEIADVVGFEPGEAECKELNKTSKQGRSFSPYFIGDGSERTFYKCNANMTSSLYEPNTELMEKFHNLVEVTTVVDTFQVQTKRLDDIDDVRGMDYLKIDVQGAELDVFKGGEKAIDDALVVHTEVEFVPMYKKQPLFAEVDQHLRSKGYVFHRFYSGMCGRTFKPIVYCDNVNAMLSQHLWADAIYIKDFMNYDGMPLDKLKKLATIMYEVYATYDLVHYILKCCDKKTGDDLSSEYLKEILK